MRDTPLLVAHAFAVKQPCLGLVASQLALKVGEDVRHGILKWLSVRGIPGLCQSAVRFYVLTKVPSDTMQL